MECIILAGGLGTRLRSAIGDHPKCMAPLNGKPFLHYILQYLEQQGCTRIVLSLGYKHEVILQWVEEEKPGFDLDYVIEQEPLGTGGGIKLALGAATSATPIVLNGDTLFQIDLEQLKEFHELQKAETTLALKEMLRFSRYGSVQLDENNRIEAFDEKSYKEAGLINGGIYCISRERFLSREIPAKFSFEKDYLEAFVQERQFSGQVNNGYFIDIGVPEDYQQAQQDFKQLFP
jgi:D-glycero-alpha-D-manno-heptose 1-phosphate guanylyltransferase